MYEIQIYCGEPVGDDLSKLGIGVVLTEHKINPVSHP